MVGIAHAGWKGTASQIGLKLIREWQKKFATNITDLRIIIGPPIGECCYEVDGRVSTILSPMFMSFPKDALLNRMMINTCFI